jgi:ribonuclease D
VSWRQQGVLALDTEFVRERTYYSRLGLIQISDGATAWLLDPRPTGFAREIGATLAATPATWVVHSASEDLEVLARAAGFVPQPLFDTQVAAALVGLGPALSLQRLLAEVLAIDLPKGETRTDWLARPLSPAQLAYAAEDVIHAVALHDRLAARLAELGRSAWLAEDCATLVASVTAPDEPADAWERVKGAGRLAPRQLLAVRLLATWRDEQARRRDLPRGFVLRDEVLLLLAARLPKDNRELQKLPGLDARQAARDATTWLELVHRAISAPANELPVPEPHLPATSRAAEEALREQVRQRATELAIAPETLVPRRILTAILHQVYFRTEPHLPDDLLGWRRAMVGDQLLATAIAAVKAAR